MKGRIGFILILVVFCVFALTLCKSGSDVTGEEETPAVTDEDQKQDVMTAEEELKAKMVFSEEAEEYLISRDWETNPKDSFTEQLIKIKTKLEENYSKAGEILAQMGAQIEDDSPMMNLISGADISDFFGKYPDRKLSFEIRHIFVDMIPEKKYIWEEIEGNEIDMVAYVVFKYRLVETEKNKSGSGYLKCCHRNICDWSCEF